MTENLSVEATCCTDSLHGQPGQCRSTLIDGM
jgi:hypothetical protein